MNRRSFIKSISMIAGWSAILPVQKVGANSIINIMASLQRKRSGVTAGANYDDITFWWRTEGITLDHPTNDYSVGDTVATLNSGASINTTSKKIGTYGLDCPTTGDNAEFTSSVSDICKTEQGRVGFWFYYNTWGDTDTIFGAKIDGNNYINLTTESGNRIGFAWKDAGSTRDILYSGSTLGAGNWYYIEGAWKASANSREIYIDGVLDNSAVSTIGTFTPTILFFGDVIGSDSSDYYLDNIAISSGSTRNFNALKNETSYPG